MTKLLLGIRKEDEEKQFERRVPLVPDGVRQLLSAQPEELELWVQPSNERGFKFERCFSDEAFRQAGARIGDQLTSCPVILGIKEIPIRDLEPGKTYAFFSHTFKGQSYNMPMFKRLLALECTVIDYEMITKNISDEDFAVKRQEAASRNTAPASLSERTVYFGHFAGVSGVIDSLWALGQRLSLEGYASNPFSDLKKSLDYNKKGEEFGTYGLAVEAIRAAGERLSKEGLPDELQPLIIGILGKGNSARGTREVLDLLPHRLIADPHQLSSFQPSHHEAKHHIYIAEFGREHTKETIFLNLLPCLTIVMNCTKWQNDEPRLITREMLREIYGSPRALRLRVIGDVTCDPGGSLEICRETFPDQPVYTYDPQKDDHALHWEDEKQREELFTNSCTIGIGLQGPVVMAVTNLPCEFPRDASKVFSEMLRPYVLDIARVANGSSFEELPVSRPVQRAIIVYKGQITPDYSYLKEKIQPRNVLVLGAGKVSPELLRHLAQAGFVLRVLDQSPEAARSRVEALGFGRATADGLIIGPETLPDKLYSEFCKADLVISLLPPSHHFAVARACIEARVSLLTASYTGAIQELHEQACSAGITLLNEMGLDPGIDHVSAIKILRESQALGEEIESFQSYCGALPAPEYAHNILRYKFSWRPGGVLDALRQEGKYLDQHIEVRKPPLTELEPLALLSFVEPFESFANRDSLAYVEKYGAKGAHQFLRATLRYPGWGSLWRALRDLGWLSTAANGELPTSTRGIAARLNLPESHELVGKTALILKYAKPADSPIASLASALESIPALQYTGGERDMVVMHHRLTTRTAAGERRRRTATLVLRGSEIIGGISAMSLTTGGMLAIGAQLILDGKFREAGVLDPTNERLAALVWPELKKKGITFEETMESAD